MALFPYNSVNSLLSHLDVGRNKLIGSIPTQFGNLVNLQHLALNQNSLTGTLPSQLTALTELTSFLYDFGTFVSLTRARSPSAAPYSPSTPPVIAAPTFSPSNQKSSHHHPLLLPVMG